MKDLVRLPFVGAWLGGVLVTHFAAASAAPDAAQRARAFVAAHEARIAPLEKQAARAWWKANLSGSEADFQAKEDAQNRMDAALADPVRFAELKALRGAKLRDPGLRRQIEVLYLQYLEKQVDPRLLQQVTAQANAVEQAFNLYRAHVDGRALTDSEVRQVLQESRDSLQRRRVWEASKGVGAVVERDLLELVRLRNQAARQLGFPDFHTLRLHLNEQDPAQVLKLFDRLETLTREPYRQVKTEIDAQLARQCGVPVAALRPWHYHDPFFQEPPAAEEASLDAVYQKVDLLQLCRAYYAGLGLPIDDVLARSDLYEKPGKNPHAFCTDIDRAGDVRVLANIVPNHYWTGTMLHELGHAVYSSKYIPATVPYVLRTDAHALATEGIALMFERAANRADWLQSLGVPVPDPAAFDRAGARMLRQRLLIFARWCQVMLRFERALYAQPDQDLRALWWDLVEKYQEVRRPEGRRAPDYASKIHIVTAPAYYHHYMMGELFASQVHHTLARQALKLPPAQACYAGRREVGEFLRQRLFAPGRTLSWNALTKSVTGATLNPKAFAADFREP
jgi:peptidyl-dipeptidase A